MPEEINNRKVFSLTEMAQSIQNCIKHHYRNAFWIKAELNKLNHYSHSGHCYPDLMDKSQGKITAQMRATLWKDDYRQINRRFKEVLNEPLKDGIKILFLGQVKFDPVYGLSLHIIDIDPSYTLGDLAREKQETIRKLKDEGIFSRNKSKNLPMLPGRIAVISVETSKGYADFLRVVDDNPWRYKFFHMLFPALLQGDKAVYSIISQLLRIQRVQQHFDLVAIIRGGGGDIGLSAYNKYELAKAIALFPLPVLTGIGHATNETVTEMVAFQNEITPTKLAESLIHRYNDFSNQVRTAEVGVIRQGQKLLQQKKEKFLNLLHLLKLHAAGLIKEHKNLLTDSGREVRLHTNFITRQNKDYVLEANKRKIAQLPGVVLDRESKRFKTIITGISKESKTSISKNQIHLSDAEKSIRQMHPHNVLKRGYSITRKAGQAIKRADHLVQDDILETTFFDGKTKSIVIK